MSEVKLIEMQTVEGEAVKLKKYEDDVVFPDVDFCDPLWGVDHVKNFKYQDGDIIMCSYPKTGFHWMGNMIWKLKSFENTHRPKDTVLEFDPVEAYTIQQAPRFICTNLRPFRMPTDHIANKGKFILVLRNPKDVIVSDYFYLKNSSLIRNKQTLDEFVQSFIRGDTPCGCYFDFMRDWDQALHEKETGKNDLKVEVFYYEDMIKDTPVNLARVNKFLGFNRDEAYLKRVLEETSMSALKKQDVESRQGEVNDFDTDDSGTTIIYRKGTIGDWKNHLTVAQSEAVDAMVAKSIKHGKICFQYEF